MPNNPLGPESYSNIYFIIGLSFLVFALAAFVIVIILFKVRFKSLFSKLKVRYLQASAKMRIKDIYNRKLNDLAKRYKAESLTDDECFAELSLILREFALRKAGLAKDEFDEGPIQDEVFEPGYTTLRDIKKVDKKESSWKNFTDIFQKLYGSQFAFSRSIFPPEIAINSARKLVNRWK
jgi:disulfide oxidoreductase YuzD